MAWTQLNHTYKRPTHRMKCHCETCEAGRGNLRFYSTNPFIKTGDCFASLAMTSDIYFFAAFKMDGNNDEASRTCSVEQEKAKRMCPSPDAPKADPGEEPMPDASIR